jgi:hypothetical protein
MLNTNILSPKVQALVSTWIGMVQQSDKNIANTYVEMLKDSPVASAANDLRILLGVSMLDKYQHPDHDIQTFVRNSINAMEGSWLNVVSQMLTFISFGKSFSEVSYKIKKRKAYLDIIRTVDPRYYWFEGFNGQISRVHYLRFSDIYIPYENGIHLINQPYIALGGDPHGVATCRRAYPYWELTKVINACMAVASERQATKLLVGKTDTGNNSVSMINPETGQPYIDPNTGEPRLFNQGYVMSRNLEDIKNNSYAVIDLADEIEAIAHESDGRFFINILGYLESMIMLSWLVPRTVTGTGTVSSGDSNLNEGHQTILRLVTRSQMQIVGEALIEQAIRPMLEFNFGELDDYGTFPLVTEDNTDTIALLNIINNCVTTGTFSKYDLDVLNKMRALAGITALEEAPIEEAETSQKKYQLDLLTKSKNQESTNFTWNKKSQRYHYANGSKKGRFVKESQIEQLTEQAIKDHLELGDVVNNALFSGKINVARWERQTAELLRSLAIYQYALGIGGAKQMDWQDYSLINGQLNLEYQYLRRFSRDILRGNLSEAQIEARIKMYYNKTNHFKERGRLEGHKRNGYLWERRVIAANHSCDDCIRYTGMGWAQIGTLPNPGENCQCKSNCKCVKYYSNSLMMPKL